MKSNLVIYCIQKGSETYKGSCTELSNQLGVYPSSIINASLTGRKVKGFTCIADSIYRKRYKLVGENGDVGITGTIEELAKKCCVTNQAVRRANIEHRKLLWKYYVERIEDAYEPLF